MKKTLAIIFCVLIITTIFPVGVYASENIMNEEEAICYIRDKMKNRENDFAFSVESNTIPKEFSSLKEKLFDKALSEEYFSTANTGDYLYWSVASANVKAGYTKRDKYVYDCTVEAKYYTNAKQEELFKSKVATVIKDNKLTTKSDYEKIISAFHD